MARRLLLMIACAFLLLSTASAAREIITLEALRELEEPCTVYVVGKTDDPYPMHGDMLQSNTRWQWLIRNSEDRFIPTGHYVDMPRYKEMNLSDRERILTHRQCVLTIEVRARGSWEVTAMDTYTAPEPLSVSIRNFVTGSVACLLPFAIVGLLILYGKYRSGDY